MREDLTLKGPYINKLHRNTESCNEIIPEVHNSKPYPWLQCNLSIGTAYLNVYNQLCCRTSR